MRTGRTLVILTVAAWLAALTPALAAPGLVGDDPVRIGIGGEIIDLLDHDDDDDDGDHGGDGDRSGRRDGHGDDDDDDDDGLLELVVEVVEEVLEALFDHDDDSVSSPLPSTSLRADRLAAGNGALPVAAIRPADDGFDDLLDFLEDVLDDSTAIEIVEDTLDTVLDSVEVVVCIVDRLLLSPMPAPCA